MAGARSETASAEEKTLRTTAASIGLILGLALSGQSPAARAQAFDRIVIDSNFPGAYQVEVADVNELLRKPDVIAVGGNTCAWYENPTWKKRVVTGAGQTPGIISSTTADFDGDGKAEIAIAFEFSMNSPKKGKLCWPSRGPGPISHGPRCRSPRSAVFTACASGDVDGDKRPDLVVASLFGPDAKPPDYAGGAPLQIFRKLSWRAGHAFEMEQIASRPVMHAIDVADLFNDGHSCILTADDLGTAFFRWGKHSAFEHVDDGQASRALTAADQDRARQSAEQARFTPARWPMDSACSRRSSPGMAIGSQSIWPPFSPETMALSDWSHQRAHRARRYARRRARALDRRRRPRR